MYSLSLFISTLTGLYYNNQGYLYLPYVFLFVEYLLIIDDKPCNSASFARA